MLHTAHRLHQLDTSKLMKVYFETNKLNGARLAPDAEPERQVLLAEQAFCDYLMDVFFRIPGAFYSVWTDAGEYVSALRMEPYQDGLLLESLETAPNERRKGHAIRLIRSVQAELQERGDVKIYAHIKKNNAASIAVHQKCGFVLMADYAALIDGSVSSRYHTFVYEK